jgi:3-carboxy-cis,cis-muconate cycloisomerase
MAARTLLQQAVPTTFGLKAAGWLEAVARSRRRITAALEAVQVLQFGGASGTLAALGAHGLAVAEALAEGLSLRLPDLPWHAHRDRLADLACALGVAAGTLGKIGRDLALLAQTEVAEAVPAPAPGQGGSSTMPHKRNPVAAAVAVAASVRAPGLVATMLAAMPQEHERGLGGWPAEWETLPELVRLAAGAARAIADALETLVVDTGRMRANLEASRGLPLAEAIRMALVAPLGRAGAQSLVEAACQRAVEQQRPLAEVLAEDPAVTAHLDPAEIRRRLSPEGYLGSAQAMIERVLSRRSKGVPDA